MFFVRTPSEDFENVEPLTESFAASDSRARGMNCLREHGVPAVVVVAVEADTANPLGWPYIATRQLVGGRSSSS